MKYVLAVLLLIGGSRSSIAQPYADGAKTRHRFAQLNLGLNLRYFPIQNTQTQHVLQNSVIGQPEIFSPGGEPQFIIGGTHFWGHTDLYVSIPMARLGTDRFTTGVETGALFYPWAVTSKKIRPFAGLSLNVAGYRNHEASLFQKVVLPVHAGMSYLRKHLLLSTSVSLNTQNRIDYHLTRTATIPVASPSVWFNVSAKYMLETTLSAEKSWSNGKAQKSAEVLGKMGLLDGYSVGVGVSSTWFVTDSEHNLQVHPYLHHPKVQSPFPELGLGYYWHRPDIHVNYAFRPIRTVTRGFGIQQTGWRISHGIEAYKFLFDYHGFVPFVGPVVSYERLSVSESGHSDHHGSFRGLGYGVVFGWDIRPNRLQNWVLRTNLRYFPDLSVQMNSGRSFDLGQIEFNFIQLVVYPQRFKKWKKYQAINSQIGA